MTNRSEAPLFGLPQSLANINNDLMLLLYARRRRRRMSKREWVRAINTRREQYGEYHRLVQEMRLEDHEMFYVYFRMVPSQFDELLNLVGPLIKKKDTPFRKAISPGERLAITLRYVATGDAMQTIALNYRTGSSTVSKIVFHTLIAIWDVLSPLVLKPPNTEAWRAMAEEFEEQWQFPNCVGSIDGKHVLIQAPGNTGSFFFNYKGTFSIVLLAVCDAKYRFTLVDIGATGRGSDGGVFANSNFGKALLENKAAIPLPKTIPGSKNIEFPHVIVGDEAFPLKQYLMRPYPGSALNLRRRIYNYRLSRARRVIENAFGILSTKWRVFRRPIIASLDTCEAVVKATICLHNYLMVKEEKVPAKNKKYCPPTYVDSENSLGEVTSGQWRTEDEGAIVNCKNISTNTHPKEAEKIRDYFAQYFESRVGAVPWQMNHVLRGRTGYGNYD